MQLFDRWTTRGSPFPFVIDNQQHQLADALNKLLGQTAGKPLDIVWTKRSALAPEAQPYHDRIDRILYRLAGLTDAAAKGLEKRLVGML
jgi:hypothetical protein